MDHRFAKRGSTAGEKRVNYYSSDITEYLGHNTGTSNNNNARTLTEVRFAAAGVGDESMQCPVKEEKCLDKYPNCPSIATTSCWHSTVKEACRLSCGLCSGLSPAVSNSCYNMYSNCDQLQVLGFCNNDKVSGGCKASCGKC